MRFGVRSRADRALARALVEGPGADAGDGWWVFDELLQDSERRVAESVVKASYVDVNGDKQGYLIGSAAVTDRALLLQLSPPGLHERGLVLRDRVDWALVLREPEREEHAGAAVTVAYVRPGQQPEVVLVALEPRDPGLTEALLHHWDTAQQRRRSEDLRAVRVVAPFLPVGLNVEVVVPVQLSEPLRAAVVDPTLRHGFIALTESHLIYGTYAGSDEATTPRVRVASRAQVRCSASDGANGFRLSVPSTTARETVLVRSGHPDDVWPLENLRRELTAQP